MLQLLQNFFGTSKVPKLFKNFFTICENFSKLFHNFANFFCELFVKLFYKLFRNFFAKLSPNFVKKWSLFLQLFATFLINFFDQILSTFLIDFLQEIEYREWMNGSGIPPSRKNVALKSKTIFIPFKTQD